jgi:BolA protein
MLNRYDRLHAALTAAFTPVQLEIVDDSAQHAGHAGASGAGETHYTITMVSPAFTGQSRVARSRAVHALLDQEFKAGLHALSLKLRSPTEA